MKYTFPIWILFAVLSACSGETEEPEIEPVLKEEIISTTTDFKEGQFDDPIYLDLLKELNVCEFKSADSTYFATCTPDNFKFLTYKEDKPVKDAFILEMKAGIFPKDQEIPLPPVRHIIVFEREGNELVRLNGFRGDLIEMRKTKSGVSDLLIAMYDTENDVLFYCWFTWKDGKYMFKEVEGLDTGTGPKPIKEEMRESVTQQIYQDIMEKSLIF